MQFSSTTLAGAVIVDLDIHADERGGFARTFCESEFAANGLPTEFPQCNLSYNTNARTLRGLHFNAEPFGETKLVRVVQGAIRDVIVDLRTDSPTRFAWLAVELSADNGTALFIPDGFGHGFVTLTADTHVLYHMGSEYQPDAARTVRWDDPAFGIDWGVDPAVMSQKDGECSGIDPVTFDLATYGR